VIELFYLASVHLMKPFLILVPLASPSEVSTGSTPRGLLIQLTSFSGTCVCGHSGQPSAARTGLCQPDRAATGGDPRQLLLVTLVLVVVVMVAEFIPPDLAMLAPSQIEAAAAMAFCCYLWP